MAFNVHEEVERRSTGIVVSASSMKYRASDGSLHMVPIINSNALAMLRNYESEEDEEVFEMSNKVDVLPPTMKNTDIHKIIMSDNTEFINYLAENSFIKKEMRCENCRSECQSRWKTNSSDSFVWQCKNCKKCFSIRKGTLFSGSKLALRAIFRIIHCWAIGIPGHSAVNLIPNVSKNSIYTWYSTCRNIVHARMMDGKISFEGKDIVVQIDETLCGKKRKYNRGKHFSQTWLFGISQPSQQKFQFQI